MLLDSTLREGAQMYGVYFTDTMRREILAGLIRCGVEEVEIGWAGQDGLQGLLQHARRIDPEGRCALTVWSPLRRLDLEALAAIGVLRLQFGVPVSDAHLENRLGLDRKGLLRRLRTILQQAMDLKIPFIGVGLEDVSRADTDFALQVTREVEQSGGQRIRLSDTVGLLTPLETARLVQRFVGQTNLPVGFHGHNDFGMGTANAVTALSSGAQSVDVSVLGIGERSGIAALEEVAAHLNIRQGARYNLSECVSLARMVAGAAGVPVARNKALVGDDIFACETGLHLQGIAKVPALFEAFAPEQVAGTRKLSLGGKSGKAAVHLAADRQGISLSGQRLEILTRRVRELAQSLARPLRDEEFQVLADTTAKRYAVHLDRK
ncbi:LeuA family protein [Desulfonatronum thioautotrophicum]|uniref:LeuA family protein n=1 Tax=Desulfonatronum thioautotrophicum TaxID=617001 RepID=UPI0005EB9514|nr:LeuA family protein [Desulfonatronum thioautotrophicum]